jgi:hypothetical protein
MTCDDLIVGIHRNRDIEPESLDAFDQRFDLAVAVFAGVG